jgi:CheY-like chemotaxis protein
MMMPGMDGLATFRALRGNPETSGIPVVFLTAKAMTAEVDRLKALGARGVLIKPFDPMALPGLLRGLLDA